MLLPLIPQFPERSLFLATLEMPISHEHNVTAISCCCVISTYRWHINNVAFISWNLLTQLVNSQKFSFVIT